MYWQETEHDERHAIPDDIVDVAFDIACRCLPVDHAWALAEAVNTVLPWIAQDPAAGIHPLHVADSGNGWMRPEAPGDLLYPSRRTKLLLRLPRTRVPDAERLCGKTLDVAGHKLTVANASVRSLSALTTIFSRYVVLEEAGEAASTTSLSRGPRLDPIGEEQAFLAEAHKRLAAIGVRPKKMLCGIERQIGTPEGKIRTRSLMLADLTVAESVRLQQEGLGPRRTLGCGLFVPHKGIQEVGAPKE
jgi:CRISPR-associated protein Cas6